MPSATPAAEEAGDDPLVTEFPCPMLPSVAPESSPPSLAGEESAYGRQVVAHTAW